MLIWCWLVFPLLMFFKETFDTEDIFKVVRPWTGYSNRLWVKYQLELLPHYLSITNLAGRFKYSRFLIYIVIDKSSWRNVPCFSHQTALPSFLKHLWCMGFSRKKGEEGILYVILRGRCSVWAYFIFASYAMLVNIHAHIFTM